jgi:hypothetical protein
MFWKAEPFMACYTQVRSCWVRGEPGSGKSLFSVALMREMMAIGAVNGVLSNIGTALPLPDWRGLKIPDDPDGGYNLAYNTGFIGDEFWLIADSRDSATNSRIYAALPRKFNNYWAFPSAIPIDVRLRYLSVERVGRIVIPGVRGLVQLLKKIPVLGKHLGPVAWLGEEMWQYFWTFDMGYKKKEGFFYLVKPSEIYPLYDTSAVPPSDAGISELMKRTVAQHNRLQPDEGVWYYEDLENVAERELSKIGVRFDSHTEQEDSYSDS